MEDIRSRLRRQIELEDEARALGASRYHARDLPWKTEAGSIDEEANLPPGKLLIKECVEPVAEAIEGLIEAACSGKAGRRHHVLDYVLLMDPYEVAYLTVRTVMNYAPAQAAMQTVAIAIADAIGESLEYRAFKTENAAGYKGLMRAQAAKGHSRQRQAAVRKLFEDEGVRKEVSHANKVSIGMKLMEIVVEVTGLFVRDTIKRKRGFSYVLKPTEACEGWLANQHARCSVLQPINMPMVVRPRRWRSPTYGGYLTNRAGNRFVKQRNAAYHEELRGIDITDCYDSVNHIQDTPWAINTRVLDVMETVWAEGTSLGGLPQREDDPVPPKPHDIDTNEEALARWKREAGQTYARNADRVSSRVALMQGLWVARRFAPEPEIFFPHELDFRGRVYPIPVFGPSPQGSDWQKALLHFAQGKPLGREGRRWLFVHIANLFGVDKCSFDERVDWTLRHAPQILDSAMNPLDGDRFWSTADDPYSALAACFEFEGTMDEGEGYISRIPIALDGSCSGLQHFSAMLRDADGGEAVNLTPNDKPADVYMRVGHKAQEIADKTATITYTYKDDGKELDKTIPNPWIGGKVIRKIVKRPTMTYCYSATRFGMQAMILQTLRELDKENELAGKGQYLGGEDNYHCAVWLSYVVYDAIRDTVSAAALAMDWLRDVATIAAKDNMPLWWTTPMGLPILQEYKKQKGRRVDTHWRGSRLRVVIQVDEETIDSRAQTNAVAPNFIHSLDASHLQSVALGCKREGIRHIAVIHDSFGTHAADTGSMSRILRETFHAQYVPDVMEDFYQQLKEQLGDDLAAKLPPPPKAGALDLSKVLEAEYTFA